ncbi:helix-turn-helix transcriptional regulator [Hymenobacter psoromatis]|uniref:helix-turn-helix transcriptional regulator n=1 Tax=Hymenobacter psoromatis TaxID=1484116 RepID=UPI001CBF0A1B|nr:helix-turn-helix domain-containing protein [Hymenobacter psoromatis]
MTTDQRIQQRIDQLAPAADFFPGPVFVHDLRTGGIAYMSQVGLTALGTTLPALRALGSGFQERYLPPRDAAEHGPRLAALLAPGSNHEQVSFLQQLRAGAGQEATWYLSTVRIFLRDEAGRPLLALTVACPLHPLSHVAPKVARLLDEHVFQRQKESLFAQLTRRERQILQLLAQGKNSVSIANELFISANTVITHRRNINAKLHPETQHELARFAYAFDLV